MSAWDKAEYSTDGGATWKVIEETAEKALDMMGTFAGLLELGFTPEQAKERIAGGTHNVGKYISTVVHVSDIASGGVNWRMDFGGAYVETKPQVYTSKEAYADKVKCQYCGQWGERRSACEHCGGAVE